MKLYLCDIRQLNGVEEQAAALLPPRRRQYALRYGQPADQRRSLAAGLLLRLVLGVERDDQLSYNEAGKPSIAGVAFNLSHGGDFALLAVDSLPVGVDIEPLRPVRESVARRMFSAAEQAWLAEAAPNSPQWLRRFFILWTRKESLIKALGLRLADQAATLELTPLNTTPHRIAGGSWYFLTRAVEGHLWSVCSQQPQPPELIQVSIEELLA